MSDLRRARAARPESSRMVVILDTMLSEGLTRLSQEDFAYQLPKLDRLFGRAVK